MREIKHHLSGRRQVFVCEAVIFTPDVALLRFRATVDYATDPVTGRPHRYTDAYFWAGRNYLMYKITGDDDVVLGYRFDVCTDVQMSGATVRWTDLLLDFWVSPDRSQGEFQDEDELAEALERGLLTPGQQRMVEQARAQLQSGFQDIIAEAENLQSSGQKT